MSSQSEYELIFSFIGTPNIVKGELLRFQAPQTFEVLFDKTREKGAFTVRGRANIGMPKTYWILLVEIKKNGEKKEYKDYKAGDIVYCPRQDALFLLYDASKISFPVYYIGKITENIEGLKTLRNGTMCKIEIKEKIK